MPLTNGVTPGRTITRSFDIYYTCAYFFLLLSHGQVPFNTIKLYPLPGNVSCNRLRASVHKDCRIHTLNEPWLACMQVVDFLCLLGRVSVSGTNYFPWGRIPTHPCLGMLYPGCNARFFRDCVSTGQLRSRRHSLRYSHAPHVVLGHVLAIFPQTSTRVPMVREGAAIIPVVVRQPYQSRFQV